MYHPIGLTYQIKRKRYTQSRQRHREGRSLRLGVSAYSALNSFCLFETIPTSVLTSFSSTILIPNTTDREKAKELFIAAVSASTQGRSWSAIITGLSALLIQYCINVYDQWKEVETHLNWSKYHFEMIEFYQHLLQNA